MNGQGVQLSAQELERVRDILLRIIPEREVWVFGSRVRGSAKPYSDLDLAVIGELPLPLATRAELAEAFDQSDLTIKVDVVDWAAASESFRQIIASQKVLLKEKA